MRHPFQRPSHTQCPSHSNSHVHTTPNRAALPPPRRVEQRDCAAEQDSASVANKKKHLRAARGRVSRRASERGRAGLRASRSLGKAVASDVQATANIVEAIAISLLPPRLVSAVDYATQQVADCGSEKKHVGDSALYTFAEAKQQAMDSQKEAADVPHSEPDGNMRHP